MVGLPNRANRCSICQRHKIKCDRSHPACTRCKRLGLSCVYLNSRPGQIFINRSVTNPLVKAVDILSNAEEKCLSGTKEKARPKQGNGGCERHNQARDISLPKYPSSEAVDQVQLLSTFIALYLPKTSQSPTVPGQTPATWVYILPNLVSTNGAYNISMKALCLSQLGIWNHNLALVREGQRLYGSALRELRAAISSPRIETPEATLATIVILSTFELFSGPSDRSQGWVSHARGGSQLLQSVGSNIRLSPEGQQFCSRIRTIGIFESFRTRKTSLLTGPSLRSPSPGPEVSGLYCLLQDIMAQVPSILEAFDMLASRTYRATDGAILVRLNRACSGLRVQLVAWCEDLRERVQGQLYWSIPSQASNPAEESSSDRIFPLAFQFPTLNIAQLLLLYWSTMIVLLRTNQGIDTIVEKNEIKDAVLRRDGSANGQIAALAKNICQSFEYCYQSKNGGTLGVQSTVFPRWVVHEFYSSQQEYQRELAWCLNIDNMTAPDSRFDLQVMKLGKCCEFAI